MIRKLACAVAVMVVAVGFVMADEFTATIHKVDGNKITYQKYKKGTKKGEAPTKDGEAVTVSAEGATVAKGTFNKDTKKVEKGDAIEGGVKALAEMVTKSGEKGVTARITTSDDNKKATQILVTGGGGKKKKAAE
jgi:hypothetical protein